MLGILGLMYVFCLQCFLKIKPKTLTFSQASDICHSYGGTLPSVLSQREQGSRIVLGTSFILLWGFVLGGCGELTYKNLIKVLFYEIGKTLSW